MELKLTPRSVEVLHSIVQTYIETGEPVASRTIARRRKDTISPATIRNIMADLADLGYLEQPHTSAGRVPTAKAFRLFAQSVAVSRVMASEMERIKEDLAGIPSMEQRAERTTHVLTELTRNVGIIAAIPASSQVLDQLELMLLAPQRVLMIVVTRDKIVRNHVVDLDQPISIEELVSIRNYVNYNFQGWTLSDVRAEIGRRVEMESAAYDSLMRNLTVLYDKGLLDIGLSPQVYLEGASNLVGLDLHLTRERLQDLFRTLEEKKRLVAILDKFLAGNTEEIQVQVGLEQAHPSMRDLSLIGVSVPLAGGLSAKLAVLGPMRMNYARAVSAVLYLGQALKGGVQ
jgi:heat-inducible transcriptional repressor